MGRRDYGYGFDREISRLDKIAKETDDYGEWRRASSESDRLWRLNDYAKNYGNDFEEKYEAGIKSAGEIFLEADRIVSSRDCGAFEYTIYNQIKQGFKGRAGEEALKKILTGR